MKRLDFLKSLILLPVASKVIIESSIKSASSVKVVNSLPQPLTYNTGLKVSKQALSDIQWFSKYISTKMSNDLINFEDNEILGL